MAGAKAPPAPEFEPWMHVALILGFAIAVLNHWKYQVGFDNYLRSPEKSCRYLRPPTNVILVRLVFTTLPLVFATGFGLVLDVMYELAIAFQSAFFGAAFLLFTAASAACVGWAIKRFYWPPPRARWPKWVRDFDEHWPILP